MLCSFKARAERTKWNEMKWTESPSVHSLCRLQFVQRNSTELHWRTHNAVRFCHLTEPGFQFNSVQFSSFLVAFYTQVSMLDKGGGAAATGSFMLLCVHVVQPHVGATPAATTTRNTTSRYAAEWRWPGKYSTEWRPEFPGTGVLNGGCGRTGVGRRVCRTRQRIASARDRIAPILYRIDGQALLKVKRLNVVHSS